MVESRAQPIHCAVTVLTSGWEIRLDMIGIGCALVIFQVTRDALRAGQVVVVVDVALRALQRRMCTR